MTKDRDELTNVLQASFGKMDDTFRSLVRPQLITPTLSVVYCLTTLFSLSHADANKGLSLQAAVKICTHIDISMSPIFVDCSEICIYAVFAAFIEVDMLCNCYWLNRNVRDLIVISFKEVQL